MSKENKKFKKHEKSIKKEYPKIEDLMFDNKEAIKKHEQKEKHKTKK
jgi:hypothetical protein